MHQPASSRSVRALKLGSLLLFLLFFSLGGSLALMVYALYADSPSQAFLGLSGMFFSLVIFILYRISSWAAFCPLCRGPVLGGSGAQRNRRAKRSFGSHRFRVARDILLTNCFVCPYCNERTLCRAKKRGRPKQK